MHEEGWFASCCCSVNSQRAEASAPRHASDFGGISTDDDLGLWPSTPLVGLTSEEKATSSTNPTARASLAGAGAVLAPATPWQPVVDAALGSQADPPVELHVAIAEAVADVGPPSDGKVVAEAPGIWKHLADFGSSSTRSLGGPAIIMLVNPKSGGNAAGQLLKLPKLGLLVEMPGGRSATVFSYPIADPDKAGMTHLSQEVQAALHSDPVRCIVAGGDGTVMWAIQEIFDAGIPTDRVLVGIIPFGTGNDFGNATGWGTSSPSGDFLQEEKGFAGMQKYVREWLRADASPYDIWEFSVKTQASEVARFEFIEKGKKACTADHIARHGIRRLPEGELEMSKYVCNYIGMGLDARVGFGFDKLRRQSRVMNKAVYVWEGAKKLLFKKKGVIAHIVQSMQVLSSDEDRSASARELHCDMAPPSQCVFSTDAVAVAAGSPQMLGNPVSLLFLNIPSISGGLDVWRWSQRKVGTSQGGKELLAVRQDFGDGRLECISYRTSTGFYLEQARAPPISGQGNRIYSGGGPLRIQFRDPADREYKRGTAHCKGRVYMQVDGEYFSVHEPRSVVIKHHATIRVLVRSEEAQGCC